MKEKQIGEQPDQLIERVSHQPGHESNRRRKKRHQHNAKLCRLRCQSRVWRCVSCHVNSFGVAQSVSCRCSELPNVWEARDAWETSDFGGVDFGWRSAFSAANRDSAVNKGSSPRGAFRSIHNPINSRCASPASPSPASTAAAPPPGSAPHSATPRDDAAPVPPAPSRPSA